MLSNVTLLKRSISGIYAHTAVARQLLLSQPLSRSAALPWPFAVPHARYGAQHPCHLARRNTAAAGNTASTSAAGARTRRTTRRSRLAAAEPPKQQPEAPRSPQAPAGEPTHQQSHQAPPGKPRRTRQATSHGQAADQQHGQALETSSPISSSKAAASCRPRAKSKAATETSPSTAASYDSNDIDTAVVQGPHKAVTQPLPHVLILHTGGTLGMDAVQSFEVDPHEVPHEAPVLKRGTGGIYGGLEPGQMLSNIFQQVPELCTYANLDLQVLFNKDSSRVGPKEWVQIAKVLDKHRHAYDAFLVVHGTDTMAYTASAISLMLARFKKPIVMTGSQLPLSSPRSDARQNLIDAITCATAAFKPPHVAPLNEVAVCFGGKLMRGNRARKVNSTTYQAFDSPGYPHLATLGVDVDWNERYLLKVEGSYVPRFKLKPAVMRVPVVPGCDPRIAYGDLVERGVKGIVLEAFGVGNFPDLPQQGWVPWLRQQTRNGLQVYLASQCNLGPLRPELYKSGALALEMGVEAGPQMTPECAVVKMMLCLAYPDIPLGQPLAGEL